jgi:transcriptional regulator with XRE-family HTH domain
MLLLSRGELCGMSESFGARLRRRREEQAISVADIAQRTKIKSSLLAALERDDVSQWPAGIFRRAYVRSYAEAIGLAADDVLREFLALYPDPPARFADESAPASQPDDGRVHAPPTRLRYLVGSAFGSLARRRHPPPADSATAPTPPSTPEPLPKPPSTPVPAPVESIVPAPPTPARPSTAGPDVDVIAELCTAFGRIGGADDVPPLLHSAARLLDASGLIVWVWDELASELRAVLAAGYSDRMLAQLPGVSRDADNATAEAFRLARPCAVGGGEQSTAALAVPVLTSAGCAGVLAMELPRGGEQSPSVRAVATIVAALLAPLISGAAPAAVETRGEDGDRPDEASAVRAAARR